eukprot:gene81-84_t
MRLRGGGPTRQLTTHSRRAVFRPSLYVRLPSTPPPRRPSSPARDSARFQRAATVAATQRRAAQRRILPDVVVKTAIEATDYRGGQDKRQQSDVHYSSDGYAEFNWRFVYSKLGVRKGFPIESEISIGLYENRVLGTDFFMCEGVLDLKPYLQHAAAQQTSFSIEAEIPLTNRRLLELLQSRLAYEREKENVLFQSTAAAGATKAREEAAAQEDLEANADEDGKGDADDDERRSRKARTQERNRNKSIAEQNRRLLRDFDAARRNEDFDLSKMPLPPAAKAFVTLDILLQTEANLPDRKVGLGRGEPNRDPILPQPRSGRTWEMVLPQIRTAFDQIERAVGKLRSGGCAMFSMVSMLFVFFCLFWFRSPDTNCAYIMNSCCKGGACGNCNTMKCAGLGAVDSR